MNEWISQGWAIHDREPARLAAELEARVDELAEAGDRARFLRLANHTIGSHLHDWPRARRLAERVAAPAEGMVVSGATLMQLAIAQFLDGDPDAALVTEAHALARSDQEPLFELVTARLALAQALVSEKRLGEGGALYTATLDLAEARLTGVAASREVASISNNIASELLEDAPYSAPTRALMERAALAAWHHWARAGTWVHEQRALYLLALVYNALGQAARAVEHGERALAIIAANGDEPIDEAFLNLALARSHRLQNRLPDHARVLARAETLARGFEDPGLKQWFASERAKLDDSIAA